MALYKLKSWPPFFKAVWMEDKTFEVRKGMDRAYRRGDRVVLREWNPETSEYTGREMDVNVSYVMRGEFGLPDDVWVLGIKVLSRNAVLYMAKQE